MHDPAHAALDAALLEVETLLLPLDLLGVAAHTHAHALLAFLAFFLALPLALSLPGPVSLIGPLLAIALGVQGLPHREEESLLLLPMLLEESPWWCA